MLYRFILPKPIIVVLLHNAYYTTEWLAAFVNTAKHNWIMNPDTIKFYEINLVLMSAVIDSEVFWK